MDNRQPIGKRDIYVWLSIKGSESGSLASYACYPRYECYYAHLQRIHISRHYHSLGQKLQEIALTLATTFSRAALLE